MANSVTPTGGSEVSLETPSASQSGLKVNGDFSIEAGGSINLVLDFDAHRSIVRAGNSGRYLLKPVINAISVDADVAGFAVTGNIGVSGASVSAQRIDEGGRAVVLRATVSDDTGAFELSPLPETADSLVDIVIERPGARTLVIRNVPIGADAATVLPSIEASIGAGASAAHVLSGQVAVPAGFEDALVRVGAQRMVDGRRVQVGEANVDTIGRDYEMTFAHDVPLVAPFDAATLSFAPPTDATARPGLSGGGQRR